MFVTPNVNASRLLFLVKADVGASINSIKYPVYVHLDHVSGEVESKCHCKAGQGGCCKQVAALLYTLLDYVNMDLKGIPRDITCTEVGQKWNVPSKYHAAKAFKFQDLLFEKAEERKNEKDL